MGYLNAQEAVIREALAETGNILVTGGTGFIGRHLLRALNEYGAHPLVLDLMNDEPPGNVEATWVRMDITDHEAVRSLIEERHPEIIIHLAAVLGSDRSYGFAQQAVDVNFNATHNLLKAAGELAPDLKRIVLMGSAEEYGNANVIPITEHAPAAPVSPYSASKASASQFAQLYHTLFQLPVTVLRPFIIYGPGQSPNMMLPQLIRHAVRNDDFPMTEGTQTRDFVYIDDVVNAILLAATVPGASGEVFNICSGEEHSIRSIAEQTVRLAGSETQLLYGNIPTRRNEVMRLVGSNEKAQHILGWQPQTTLAEGLQKSIEWYRQYIKDYA